jgi:predicted acetyltransferase
MEEKKIQLVAQEAAYQNAFLEMVQDYQQAGELTFLPFLRHHLSFESFLERIELMKDPQRVPEGMVPESGFWLLEGDAEHGRLLGEIRIRHILNEFLLQEGGHIGYTIRPSARRMGYGSLQLRLALPLARDLGIQRALVTCNTENIGSARIIEQNGGVLENQVISANTGKQISRYWITL